MLQAALLLLTLSASPAAATWSIVAVDPATGEVGIAAASCIGCVEQIAGVVPGKGVIAAQAVVNAEARRLGMNLIAAGSGPWAVVAELTKDEFDPGSLLPWLKGRETRQYGVVVLGYEDWPASFTGQRTIPSRRGRSGFGVAVQGNLLRGEEVVDAALGAYERARHCTLGDRLVVALGAGSRAGGDRRCSRSLAALSAFLEVARPDDEPDAPYVRMLVPYEGGCGTSACRVTRQIVFPERGPAARNPARRLRSRYLSWRLRDSPGDVCPLLLDERLADDAQRGKRFGSAE